eukprot:Rmarinus@m.12700
MATRELLKSLDLEEHVPRFRTVYAPFANITCYCNFCNGERGCPKKLEAGSLSAHRLSSLPAAPPHLELVQHQKEKEEKDSNDLRRTFPHPIPRHFMAKKRELSWKKYLVDQKQAEQAESQVIKNVRKKVEDVKIEDWSDIDPFNLVESDKVGAYVGSGESNDHRGLWSFRVTKSGIKGKTDDQRSTSTRRHVPATRGPASGRASTPKRKKRVDDKTKRAGKGKKTAASVKSSKAESMISATGKSDSNKQIDGAIVSDLNRPGQSYVLCTDDKSAPYPYSNYLYYLTCQSDPTYVPYTDDTVPMSQRAETKTL